MAIAVTDACVHMIARADRPSAMHRRTISPFARDASPSGVLPCEGEMAALCLVL